METMRPSANWSQVSLKTLALAVAVAASILALVAWLLKVPSLQRHPMLAISGVLVTFGLILPALWVGAVRRFTLDGLLAHVAVVAALSRLLFSSEGNPRLFFAFILSCLVLSLLVPSIAWYIAMSLGPGSESDRVRRWAAAYTKYALQVAFGFVFFIGLSIVVLGSLR